MNCYKCATPLPDHSKFCMACGADVSGEGHMHSTVGGDEDPELMAALQAELGTDYTIERELGRGGMAIVYLGKDTHLGRKVAIKLLPPMLTFGGGPGLIERFKREARTSATLDHPHIIPVYRVSTGGKLFWYVMKYLQGESVDEMLKRDELLTVDTMVDIISQAADALDYAHQNEVVHRDVKPANMMIDKKGWVTVTDFGIAKALNTGTLTGSGAAIGTPHYMSPEQCVGVGVSGASDQYALGISAYQMLSGNLPFKADSILELLRMHAMDPPPPLDSLRSGLPPGLVAAVERALAKEQKDRFPSCGDFAREMIRWTRDAEVAARRPTAAAVPPIVGTVPERLRFKPVVKGRADTPAKAATDLTAEPASRRWFIIAGLAIAVVLAGGFFVYKSLQPPTPIRQEASLDNKAAPKTEADSLARARATTQSPQELDSAVTPASGEKTKQAGAPTSPPSETKGKKAATATKSIPPKAIRPAPVKPDTTPVAGIATLSVGSRPSSAISINGKPVPGNPVVDHDVPSGRVLIRFQVTDTTGIWYVDTVLTLAPGEKRSLGRVQLRRP